MSNTLIRNNTGGLYAIGAKTLLPGQTVAFTQAELQPFIGNLAFQARFKSKELLEVTSEETVEPIFLQPPKPELSKIPGETKPIDVSNSDELAKFIQGKK